MIKAKLDYNLNWSEHFRIDNCSPSGLARIKNKRGAVESDIVGTQKFKKSGEPTGWQLWFYGKTYLVHRIIWVLTYGSIDQELVIDHLDGDPFNNRIDNLSLKTMKNNSRNQRKRSDNTTGITGVLLINNGKGNYYYTSQWYEIDGCLKCKHFSVSKLGEAVAKTLAINYRKQQIQRLILEGADYTNRHGN